MSVSRTSWHKEVIRATAKIPRLERAPDRSEQGKPWPGPPTWAAVISLDRPLGLADDYVTAKWNLQSTKILGRNSVFRVFRPYLRLSDLMLQ